MTTINQLWEKQLQLQNLLTLDTHIQLIANVINNSNPQNILDVGCAQGDLLEKLSQRFPQHHFVGIDLNEEFIIEAQRKNKKLIFIKSDINTFPKSTDKKFDCIIFRLVIQHLDNYQNLFNILKNICNPSCQIIVIDACDRYELFHPRIPLFESVLHQFRLHQGQESNTLQKLKTFIQSDKTAKIKIIQDINKPVSNLRNKNILYKVLMNSVRILKQYYSLDLNLNNLQCELEYWKNNISSEGTLGMLFLQFEFSKTD